MRPAYNCFREPTAEEIRVFAKHGIKPILVKSKGRYLEVFGLERGKEPFIWTFEHGKIAEGCRALHESVNEILADAIPTLSKVWKPTDITTENGRIAFVIIKHGFRGKGICIISHRRIFAYNCSKKTILSNIRKVEKVACWDFSKVREKLELILPKKSIVLDYHIPDKGEPPDLYLCKSGVLTNDLAD